MNSIPAKIQDDAGSHGEKGFFETSLEHLMAELQRIDLRLRLLAWRMRRKNGRQSDNDLRGLYISDEEIDSLVASGLSFRQETNAKDLGDSSLSADLQRLEEVIEQRKCRSVALGIRLRLCELAAEFNLSDFEVDTLLVCLLPEVDIRYERLYAYLHDDITRKRPSVNLVMDCLIDSFEGTLAARDAFLPQSPLIARQLIHAGEEAGSRSPSLLSMHLKIEDRIAGYLLGSDLIDARVAAYSHLVQPAADLDRLVLSQELKAQSMQLSSILRTGNPAVVYLQGPQGAGKKTLAEAICKDLSRPLLVVSVADLLSGDLPAEVAIMLAFREAKLLGSALCWERLDLLLPEEGRPRSNLDSAIEGINRSSGPVLATGELSWQPGDSFGNRLFARIQVNIPDHETRRRLWAAQLDGCRVCASEEDLKEIADKFRFTPAQVRNAAAAALNLSAHAGGTAISTPQLYSACRATCSQRLGALARKIEPAFTWNDIVLPVDQTAQLHEIANHIRYEQIVFLDWNFGRKLPLGRGVNILFAGPSGTGKTMAAQIMAGELGLDLYKIDLSTVISKYIGETEKNLDKIFTEAQNSNAILFFDEADAVFGKRSEVRDSHDRYANIEIAYLLQKTEEYDGIVILATNLRKNLDEAFARRMNFSIEFPLPDEGDRYRIWERIFPEEAPLAADVDLAFMARQFKLTGGNIRNIALEAAFLAAENGGSIRIAHLIRATKREFQKIGRLCTEADFAEYFALVNG